MDLIVTNANIITMDADDTRADALAVRWGKFSEIGESERIRALAGPDTRVIDLGGKTLLPGFIDTHNHLSFYGYLVSSVDCRAASGVASIDDIVDRLRAEADKTALENRIKAAIGDNTYGLLPNGGKYSWKTQQRKAYQVSASSRRVLLRLK